MNSTILLILATIVILFLFLLLMYWLRRSASLSLEGDTLVIKHLFGSQRIDLSQELENWKVQKAYYLRWGEFYSINMLFKSGHRRAVGSSFNQDNYKLLYHHLSTHFGQKQVPD